MKVAIVLTARPSWAKLETVCRALQAKPDVELQIIACTSALLPEFGDVASVVESQGFPITERLYCSYAGSTLQTSAKETGALLIELSAVFSRLKPDVVCVMADRHEVLAAAQAASYLHIPLLHAQGGERTGSIDDKVRAAISQLADVHCVATERAKWRVYGLTGSQQIYQTGCPSIDLAIASIECPPVTAQELGIPQMSTRFVVVLQHPVTTEVDMAGIQILATWRAARDLSMCPALMLLPGADSGSVTMRKVIAAAHTYETVRGDFHIIQNLAPGRFLKLIQQCACLVGNSSAGIREASALGVPVVNIGSRQDGRERARNVLDAPHDAEKIRAAIDYQVAHGPYPRSQLYGSGHSGQQIADRLCQP